MLYRIDRRPVKRILQCLDLSVQVQIISIVPPFLSGSVLFFPDMCKVLTVVT